MSLLLLALALISTSPPADPQPPGASVGQVVVVGRKRTPEAVPDDVKRFLAVPNDQLLARWYEPPCPVVAGLGEAQNHKLTGEMVDALVSVKVKPGGPSCKPNIYVFITSDPDALAEEFAKTPRRFFIRDRASDIRASLKTPNPVRWRLSSDVMLSTGERPKILYIGGQPVEDADGRYLPTDDHARGDRIRSSFREDLSNVVILVDAHAIDGVGFKPLAAYLTMAGLAQIRSGSGFDRIDTIMNLFGASATQTHLTGFTSWDRRFLRGLYTLDPESRAETQRSHIADAIKGGADGK